MAQPRSTSSLVLLVACLAVIVVMADTEEGGCSHAGPGQMQVAGMCPPIKVHIPYPGFTGNYGANAMYRHAGAKWNVDSLSGRSSESVWYEHHVAVSAHHPASTLRVLKSEDHAGATVWKLARQVQGESENSTTEVSRCSSNVKFPWLCDTWNPPLKITQMTWQDAHHEALGKVKAGLRYAEAVKALGKAEKDTEKLQRAASNVKEAISRVREIERKAHRMGVSIASAHPGVGNGIGSSSGTVKEVADKAAVRAAEIAQKRWEDGHKLTHEGAMGSAGPIPPHLHKSPHGSAAHAQSHVYEVLKSKAKHKEVATKKVLKILRKELVEKHGRKQNRTHHLHLHNNATRHNASVMHSMHSHDVSVHQPKQHIPTNRTKKVIEKQQKTEAKLQNVTAAPREHKGGKQESDQHESEEQKAVEDTDHRPQTVRATLHLGGVTEEKMRDPKFREAFIKASAAAMGVSADDIHILDGPTMANQTTQQSSTRKDDVNLMAVSESVTRRGYAASMNTVLLSKDADVTFKVQTSGSTGTANAVASLSSSVAKGQFAKTLKDEASARGVDVDPTANVVATASTNADGQNVSMDVPEVKSGSSGASTPLLVPPLVPQAPAPPQASLPMPTRWDSKGKTGTFTRCASSVFGGQLMLMCPRGTRVSKILYADLGTAKGSWCGWKTNPICSFPDALPLVKAACEGKPHCIIAADLDLLAVREPVSTDSSRLDMNSKKLAPPYATSSETVVPEHTKTVAQYLQADLNLDENQVVDDAVDAAMRDAIIPEQHVSRSLLFNAKPAERCWAAKQAGAKLVVRAECTGTMDHLGLMTAPSMTAGTVTVSGLPYAAFTASPAYQKAFVLAMEAAQCQCDVTDPTCINDECAGNVEIEKTGGDAGETDIMFKVRIPPTRTTDSVEAILAVELHSESARYKTKEMAAKAQAKAAEQQRYAITAKQEAEQKSRVQANEFKEKAIYAEQEQDHEKRKKEKEKKVDMTKWSAERKQKHSEKEAEHAQDEAAKASEAAMKAHYLHSEARAKRRAANEVVHKKERAANEVVEKQNQAKAALKKASKDEQARSSASDEAAKKFQRKHAYAQEKSNTVEAMRAEDGAEFSNAGADNGTIPAAMEALIVDDAVKGAVEGAMASAVETELLVAGTSVTSQTHPSFSENMIAAAKMEGIPNPYPIGASVDFAKAQQASALADANQLGVPPPAPPKEDDTPAWFMYVFLIILGALLCLCLTWCYCKQGSRAHNPHSSAADYYGIDDVSNLRQNENFAQSGVVDANGLPIMGGGGNAPIGSVMGGSGSRSILGQIGRDGGAASGRSGQVSDISADPRREYQKKIVAEELEAAFKELNAVPWFKRQAVQSRINELEKWKAKIEDESRPMYATAYDRSAGMGRSYASQSQRQMSAANFEATTLRPNTAMNSHGSAQQL